MPQVFDIQQFWLQNDLQFPAGGNIYFGIPGSDPTVGGNQIPIFSDRGLTVALANPQPIDTFGRSTNKVWLGVRYAVAVYNAANDLIYYSGDNGENLGTANIITLSNVVGTDNVTADSSIGITEYEDLQLYTLRAVGNNTTNMTINIDGVGAIPLESNGNALVANNVVEDANILFSYNLSETRFDLLSRRANIPISPLFTTVQIFSGTTLNVLASQNGFYFPINTQPQNTTVNLPQITAAIDGFRYGFTKFATPNSVFIQPTGSDKIKGGTVLQLAGAFHSASVIAWYDPAMVQNQWLQIMKQTN